MLGSVPYPSLGVAPLVWATPTLPLLQVTSTYLFYLSIVSTNISTNLTNLSTNLHVVSRAIQIYTVSTHLYLPLYRPAPCCRRAGASSRCCCSPRLTCWHTPSCRDTVSWRIKPSSAAFNCYFRVLPHFWLRKHPKKMSVS